MLLLRSGKPAWGFLVLCAVSFGVPAMAQPTLVNPKNGADPISITLDQSDYTGTFAIEIDGVDVTALMLLSGDVITVTPASALSAGPHTITLYLLSGDSFTIVGEWEFSTIGSSIIDSITLEATHEAGADRRQNGTTDTRAESTGKVMVSLFDGRIDAGANYIATTVPYNQINGNPVDLGEYYLEFRQTTNSFDLITRLGHQGIDYDDMIVSNIRRRGVGVTVETTSQRTFFGVFATQASETLGVENFTGLGTADDRLTGATLALEPFATTDLRLGITGYQGRGIPDFGTEVGAGDGISLSISGSINDGRLRYSLSGGQTNWDNDAEGIVEENYFGQALRAAVDYDVIDPYGANADKSLTIGVTYEQSDINYFSFANPSAPYGVQTLGLTANYASGPWSLSAYGSYQRTNFGGPADYETDAVIHATLSGSYTPYTQSQAPRWAGNNPLINFGIGYDGQNRLITPPLALAQQDFSAINANIDFSTSYDDWGWGLGYGFYYEDNKYVGGTDVTIHSIFADADWYALDWLSLSGDLAIDFVDDVDGQYMDGNVNFYATVDLIPDELLLSARYTLEGSNGPFATNGGTFGADVTWLFHPAADLVFSGGIAHGDYATLTPDDPEWFAGIKLRIRTNIYR